MSETNQKPKDLLLLMSNGVEVHIKMPRNISQYQYESKLKSWLGTLLREIR